MEKEFLPGTLRDRIQDLMKSRKVTQKELADLLGVTVSTISRFLSGSTDKFGNENVIRIARAFNVSTDFLLGETDVPDRKNYQISELGLSSEAARNLYKGRADQRVVSRMLENKKYLALTRMISKYFNDTFAAGFAAQNELYASLSEFVIDKDTSEAADDVADDLRYMRTNVYQADL
ncbi:helix-turn-helix domain-containing protein [Butyrivibrio sp. INlla16]|uniref:helix-turn-helix domain-containing protein n=1 Tax=Butyrivibrio sp. INlla16 TaxID=1520807 RepID=UPI000883ADC0|nr:helix-turn-helix transcriptional regulator [Butyrivibrio sp. INlla16]SDB45740.1 Transcriptional regulator, contains XRE-family HTH domain [Butyrivibrio sp. INlla16]